MIEKTDFEKIRELVGTDKENTKFVCDMCHTRQFMGIEVPECSFPWCHDLQTLCYLAKKGYDCDVYPLSEKGAFVAVLVMPDYYKWGYSAVYRPHHETPITIGDETWESYDQYGKDAETMSISDFCNIIHWSIWLKDRKIYC